MSTATLEKIRRETETLTPSEKISLAEHLWATLPPNPAHEKLWLEEAKRRALDAKAGKSGYVNWDDVKSKYEKRIEKITTPR